jgi:hypothetical protein
MDAYEIGIRTGMEKIASLPPAVSNMIMGAVMGFVTAPEGRRKRGAVFGAGTALAYNSLVSMPAPAPAPGPSFGYHGQGFQ